MYENFTLRQTPEGNIAGYLWDVADPKKVVCIVHGIGEYGGRFDRVALAFKKAGMAVCALDLRGHGNSLGKKGHCAPRGKVLDDVTALIQYAQNKYPGKEVILYGHSMGGNIVLDYRSRGELNSEIAGYIVSAPWVRLVRPVPPALYRIVKIMAKLAPSMAIGSDVDEATLGNPETVKPYHDNPMVHNKISAQCAVDGFEIGLAMEDGSHENNGGARNIPTLLMHGSGDKICDVEGSRRIAAQHKDEENFTYIEWDGLFHEIHNGNATSNGDEVIEKTVEWADEL